MKPVASDGPDDWFFDQAQQRWLRHSGVARWHRILAERAANQSPHVRADLLERLGLDPDRPTRQVFRAERRDGYAGVMRRPDIELPDDAARFVEKHPDMIARLAGQPPAAEPNSEPDDERRAGFRDYIRERLAAARSPEAAAEGQAFLARYTD